MRSLACLVIFVGCSYPDPDLDETRFRCDGGKPCPEGQVCAGAVCVVPTHDGVGCMMSTCPSDQACCVDGTNAPHCFVETETCPGTAASCDGVEDCPNGTRCCADGVVQRCVDEARCGVFACLQDEDCPNSAPNCCPEVGLPVPWKACTFFPCQSADAS